MHACVLHAIGDLRYESVNKPELPPGWATVKVGAVGVCGSDLPRIFRKGTYSFPLIPGHEMAGTVEHASGEQSTISQGDRVVVFPLIPCGKCEYCSQNLSHLCDNYDYLGSRRDGGFADYLAAPEANLLKIPNGVGLDEAAMSEPCAVALHALHRGAISEGDRVWIVGAGTIGLLLARLAYVAGKASNVFISDIDKSKLELASEWAGAVPIDATLQDPVKAVLDLTGGRGADLVVEAVGVEQTINQTLCGVRKRGRVVLMGNPAGDIRFPQDIYWNILRREITVTGTWNSIYDQTNCDEWHAVLNLMSSGVLNLQPLISHRVCLADAPDMLKKMQDRIESYVKVLIYPQ